MITKRVVTTIDTRKDNILRTKRLVEDDEDKDQSSSALILDWNKNGYIKIKISYI